MYQRILLQIFLLGLCLYSNAGANDLKLWIDPPTLVVKHGDSLSATCSTNFSNIINMAWETSQGNTIENSPTNLTWTANVTEWNIKPFCYVNVNGTGQIKDVFNLIVYKAPDLVSISTVNHTGPMTEGKLYELQCEIQNVAPVRFLTVNWFKGDTLVEKKSFTDLTKTPVNVSETLQISPSRDDNATQYRCEAKLDLGAEGPQPPPSLKSVPFVITVFYGPEISCSHNITVIEGQTFTPKCTVIGYPRASTTWYKEGEKVDFPQKIDRNERGDYTLIAINTNTGKTTNHTLKIEVLYPPSSIEKLEIKSLKYGGNEVLKCSSAARPLPKYTWNYPPMSNVKTEDVDGVSILYINYATIQNLGTYECIASNDLGNVNKSISVDMKDTSSKVSISTGAHSGPFIESRQYELFCEVQYVPPLHLLNLRWYKDETLVKNTTFENLKNSETRKNGTLQVFHHRKENGTQYRCEAAVKQKPEYSWLSIGRSDPLNITVHYKPVINEAKLPSEVPVFRGYPEVLVCEAEGYPQPTITWSYKGFPKVEGGNLTITEATNENVGLYNCTASNDVDTTVRVVKVTLKEDYLPLIAGFVALAVVSISIIFVVIYSIYYKNTKMGRYTVEGAKPSAQNGDVAQNGKDSTIPMKKLSQNSISSTGTQGYLI
ncbi:vascular cell adhesion protein 1 [Hoplias malabaricus]|uniref:vascular cell adhesion protein 1 n=1 Tax=Hoplias malabaricus TaxID=27720 RepID=UPI0034619334